MKTLAPVLHRESYTRAIEAELIAFVEDTLLKPLRDVRLNSVEHDALLAAIAAGRVWHDGLRWRGTFNLSISKRIRDLGGFEKPYHALPPEVQDALRDSAAKFSAYKAALLGLLATIEGNVRTLPAPFDPTPVKAVVTDAAAQFEKSVEGVPVNPVPVGAVEEVAEEAVAGLTGYQTQLVLDGVAQLRKELAKAATPADLEDRVAIVSTSLKRRAALGADQSASETVADVRETLSESVGIEEYEWVTMGDSKVRHDHKMLDGRIFRFDNPPVVDTATGRRGNPGEDHNCRCFARPVIRT